MDEIKPILTLREACKSFSGVQVLKNVSLELYPGEVHCLVGENGAGKSTLIMIISGAYQPDSGQVIYHGDIEGMRRDPAVIAAYLGTTDTALDEAAHA